MAQATEVAGKEWTHSTVKGKVFLSERHISTSRWQWRQMPVPVLEIVARIMVKLTGNGPKSSKSTCQSVC